ncbi:DUF1236 domain-containing protein [Microvirga lotononidis]|uniref:DUF1236 domain-containing protein n=1 Tax=Microvirga lotononidis TaxID=864069 RepID=I4YLG5_9HYPH|nr:DUF1236 domain-containing protein [Microvirga lotononidis]EIM24807.1 Protein of unknown function (DUF1236) [Microvirga lotononidis]WQO29689.1 DUF1236 domain-containing protein [Microvirga lotononidis]
MKAAYHLAWAFFSVGAVAAPTTAPNATDPAPESAGYTYAVPGIVRNVASEVSSRLAARPPGSAAPRAEGKISISESLSHSVELHAIPRHETYRYAMVDGHRLIVDAASRTIIYVIQ